MNDVDMEQEGRAAKHVIVPTSGEEVVAFLRALQEPITLFGEGKLERRNRLRDLLAELDQEAVDRLQQALADADAGTLQLGNLFVEDRPQGTFFTEGSSELREFRAKVARYSIPRARERLRAERAVFEAEGEAVGPNLDDIKAVTNQASELADTRPVVSCAFSPTNDHIAAASWSGTAKIWDTTTLKPVTTIEAHEERLTSVVWHPSQAHDEASNTVRLATGSADCTAKLWTASGTLLRTLEGHTDRLARIAMHPMGEHLATASFDLTWRLWDLETGAAILEQEVGIELRPPCVCLHALTRDSLTRALLVRSFARSLVRLPGTQQTGLWRVLQRRRVAGGQRWVLNSTDVRSHAYTPPSLSLSHPLTLSLVLRASLARQAHSTGMAESGISGQDGRSLYSRGTLEGSLTSTFAATVGIDLDRRALARPPSPDLALTRAMRSARSSGHTIATGGDDNTARIFDLRKNESVAVLLGHNKLLSQVRFDEAGSLVTASFDGSMRIWCRAGGVSGYTLASTLITSSKIMGMDVARDVGKGCLRIVTGEWNKTLKAWEK